MRAPSVLPAFPWLGLLTLAGAAFVSVTSEFLPTGLLPDMARDLHVSVSTTGLLVTVFAVTVVAATTPLATLTRGVSRKKVVIGVLLTIAAANLAAALAPNYALLVAARILGGAAHGLFWGVVAAYPTYLVSGRQLGRAIAVTSAGSSAAFVLGVPLGTALGHALGWRAAFAIIAGVVLVLTAVVVAYLPPAQHRVPLATGEIPLPIGRDRTLRPVIVLCVVIVTLLIGQNTLYTYIAPWFLQAAALPSSAVPVLLFLYGGAGAVGLAISGVLADRRPRVGLAVMILAIAASVLALALGAGNAVAVVVAFVAWGLAFGGLPALVGTHMMHLASPRVRGLAGALQTTAFNVGIGGGALLGAVLLGGPGIGALPIATLVFLAAGLALGYAPQALRLGTRRVTLPTD